MVAHSCSLVLRINLGQREWLPSEILSRSHLTIRMIRSHWSNDKEVPKVSPFPEALPSESQ